MKIGFFSRRDWLAFWTATLVSLVVYVFTLGPSVGLEDSGELATAAASMGVPHPPGYPFWTFCSWIFTKAFFFVEYMGHPSPAWAVSLASAVFGAVAAGCCAMLISRSASDFSGEGRPFTIFSGSVAGALAFAFSPVEWSQSTIVEIYSLNALFLMLVFLLSYRWMREPSNKTLWATAFVFGLGLTNYQVLLFALVPLMVIIAIKDIKLFRDFVIVLLPALMCYQVLQIAESDRESYDMQSDVIKKHLPVGIDSKEYVEKKTFLCYPRELGMALFNRDAFSRLRKKASRSDSTYDSCLRSIDKTAQNLTPSVKKDIYDILQEKDVDLSTRKLAEFDNAEAKTKWCIPSVALISSFLLALAAIFSLPYLKTKYIDKRTPLLIYAALISLAVLIVALGMSACSQTATWSGKYFKFAPLAEPYVYALVAIFIMLSVSGAVYSKYDTRALYISAAFAVSAVLTVLLLVPEAKGVELLSGIVKYQGEVYSWGKATIVFVMFIAALIALGYFADKAYAFLIPVIGCQLALFLLVERGAMNSLTHPTTWWFWWPLVWNLIILALAMKTLPNGKRVALAILFAELGVAFYIYMPIVSDWFNPPMNWGYPRTWEGFKHAISRGQYEAIAIPEFSSTIAFMKHALEQMAFYLRDVRLQFTLLLVPFALVPFVTSKWVIEKKDKVLFWQWMAPLVACFLMMTLPLIVLAKVRGDVQDGFIQKVKFISSHAMLGLWIGYGFIFVMILMVRHLPAKFKARAVVYFGSVALMIGAFTPIYQNYFNGRLVFEMGGAEQNGHTFGWQFGAFQLDGAVAIKEMVEEDEEPLPNPDYPPAMENGAIFFGGTDPGRFVPTYMTYAADYRSDIHIITQNALADDTYMSVERDLYGDKIWIPTVEDVTEAFRIFQEKVKSGQIKGDGFNDNNGRIQVTGARQVMEINKILARMIFDHEKDRRAFYIEESYEMPWMDSYLSAHGLIMKVNANEVGFDEALLNKDRDFWSWYSKRLLDDKNYRRDFAAQKSFSKLRLSIARMLYQQAMYYVYRRDRQKAEALFEKSAKAFREARMLYPASPEASVKYFERILLNAGRYAAAQDVIDYFNEVDPNNQWTDQAQKFLNEIMQERISKENRSENNAQN